MEAKMLARPLLRPILEDALTRGLGDPEARVLVEWLVERAERLAGAGGDEEAARGEIGRLCRRARAIGRFVYLWCLAREPGAACQLAAAERFPWPLPDGPADPCDLMQDILNWEAEGGGPAV
jgi:hypothetical protein